VNEGGGAVLFDTSSAAKVRLIGAEACKVFAVWSVEPDRRHLARFTGPDIDSTANITDSETAFEMGPACPITAQWVPVEASWSRSKAGPTSADLVIAGLHAIGGVFVVPDRPTRPRQLWPSLTTPSA